MSKKFLIIFKNDSDFSRVIHDCYAETAYNAILKYLMTLKPLTDFDVKCVNNEWFLTDNVTKNVFKAVCME